MPWVAQDEREEIGPSRGPRDRLNRCVPTLPGSPGWLFHLGLALVGVMFLSATSIPGGVGIPLLTYSGMVFLAAAVAWGLWLLRWSIVRARNETTWSAWRFLVAPVGGTVFVGALMLDLPLQARWSLAKPSFDRIVETAPAAPDPEEPLVFEAPDVAGPYRVERAVRVGDDVFVSVRSDLRDGAVLNGGFLRGSGFAYIPNGRMPSPEVVSGGFELHYRHVRGDWYAWSSYW